MFGAPEAARERRAVLHIGSHKTGTSAIQHALATNRGFLRRQGYFYPHACKWAHDHSHNHLAVSMFAAKESGDRGGFDAQLRKLEAEVAKSPHLSMIFSSEMLEKAVLIAPEHLADFLSMLGRHFGAVDLVYCLRDEASLCDSMFKQLVQGNVFKGTAEGFLGQYGHVFDFPSIAELWRATGAVRSVDAFWYDGRRGKNLATFLRVVGLRGSLDDPGTVNASLDGALLEIKHALNRATLTPEQNAFVNDRLRSALKKIGPAWRAPTTIFDDRSRAAFVDRYSKIDYADQKVMVIHNERTPPKTPGAKFRLIGRDEAVSLARELRRLGYRRLAWFMLDVL